MTMRKKPMKMRGIRLPEEMWEALKKKAKDEKATPSDVVRFALEKFFGKKV